MPKGRVNYRREHVFFVFEGNLYRITSANLDRLYGDYTGSSEDPVRINPADYRAVLVGPAPCDLTSMTPAFASRAVVPTEVS